MTGTLIRTSPSDYWAIFPPSSMTPSYVAIGYAILAVICAAWLVYSFRHVTNAKKRNRVSMLMACAWIIFTIDSVASAIYSGLYMQCDNPYIHQRPTLEGGQCKAMLFYSVKEATTPIGCAVFLTASIFRFMLTVKSLGEGARYHFLRIANGIVLVASVPRLFASVWFSISANERQIDLHNETDAVVAVNALTELILYSLLAVLDISSVILGIQYVYAILWDVEKAVDQGWMKLATPQVLALKAQERRYLIATGVLLFANLVIFVCAMLVATEYLSVVAVLPLIVHTLVLSVLLRLFGICEMLVIMAVTKAVKCNNEAAVLMSSLSKSGPESPGSPPADLGTMKSRGGQKNA